MLPADSPLLASDSGTWLPVKVLPNAKHSSLRSWEAGRLKLAVTASPEKGEANAAVIALLAAELAIAKNRITLVKGATHGHKLFLIRDLSPTQVWERLAPKLSG